uniref:GNAT family N-acetyltransferase n=1 Tax=Roseovarius indicus TaxID=540747 RepID=UPI003B525AB9
MGELVQAEEEAQLEAVRALMRGFVDWHLERHADSVSLIRKYFDRVKFETELADLPGDFRPPRGRLLLAVEDGEALGCIALHDLGDGVCEMKRLFVAPGHHGRGLGQLLAQRVIAEAVAIGYHTMRLDTGPKQAEAQGLYTRLGFRRIDPYYELDPEMRDWLIFMERDLTAPVVDRA